MFLLICKDVIIKNIKTFWVKPQDPSSTQAWPAEQRAAIVWKHQLLLSLSTSSLLSPRFLWWWRAVSCELRCCGVTRAGPCTGILYISFPPFLQFVQSITRRDSDFEILCISRHNPAFKKISLRYVKILNNIIIFGICRSNENGKRY